MGVKVKYVATTEGPGMRRYYIDRRSPADGQSGHYHRGYLIVGPAAPRDHGPLLCAGHAEEAGGCYCVDQFVCGRADCVHCRTADRDLCCYCCVSLISRSCCGGDVNRS
jgi:hypothetical protein